MKNLFIFLFLYVSYISVGQTPYISSCLKLDTITNYYQEDAEKLNFLYIWKFNDPYKDSVPLNPTITDRYQRVLLAVYNATNMPSRDSVVRIFNIHTAKPGPGLHSLLVQADSNFQWMKNIRANIFPTGNYTIDSLMTKYQLSKHIYLTSVNPYASLSFKTPLSLNMRALADFITKIPGVNSYHDNFALDGSNIIDSTNPNFHMLRYSFGWDDCENICHYHKYWGFKIYNDCSVEFLGTYGNDLTVGISEHQSKFGAITAYPNPVVDQLIVEGVPTDAVVSISNALGGLIRLDRPDPCQNTYDLRMYPPGVYILRVTGSEGQRNIKIVKQ